MFGARIYTVHELAVCSNVLLSTGGSGGPANNLLIVCGVKSWAYGRLLVFLLFFFFEIERFYRFFASYSCMKNKTLTIFFIKF